MHELRIGVSYDFRNTVNSGVSDAHLYAEILEQVKWLDQIGADMVWCTEHHFVEEVLILIHFHIMNQVAAWSFPLQ